MRVKQLFAGVLAAGLSCGVRAQSTRPPDYLIRPVSQNHNTLTNILLTNGVGQVVIPAGAIVNGCDITFSNSFGDFFVAWTDPGAPTVPTAVAPAGFGNVTTGIGRGIHLQNGSGYTTATSFVYRCPGPSTQGVSVFYAANYNGQSSPPVPTAIISVDVY